MFSLGSALFDCYLVCVIIYACLIGYSFIYIFTKYLEVFFCTCFCCSVFLCSFSCIL